MTGRGWVRIGRTEGNEEAEAMRQAKFVAVLVLLVGLAAGVYWYTTRADRAAGKSAAEGARADSIAASYGIDPATVYEPTPADSAAVADTVGAVID